MGFSHGSGQLAENLNFLTVIRKPLITSVQTILNKTGQNKSQNTPLPYTPSDHKCRAIPLHHPIYAYPIPKNNNTGSNSINSDAQATALSCVL
jgi:hypothetical protein